MGRVGQSSSSALSVVKRNVSTPCGGVGASCSLVRCKLSCCVIGRVGQSSCFALSVAVRVMGRMGPLPLVTLSVALLICFTSYCVVETIAGSSPMPCVPCSDVSTDHSPVVCSSGPPAPISLTTNGSKGRDVSKPARKAVRFRFLLQTHRLLGSPLGSFAHPLRRWRRCALAS